MSVVHTAVRLVRRAADNPVLERTTRAGFLGYGLLHLALAWLSLRLAFGSPPHESDPSGAFRTVADQPFGRWLLAAIAVGLAAMALWQGFEAAAGHRNERRGERRRERIFSVGRAAIYAALALTAARIVLGAPASSASQQEQATGGLLDSTAGRWLVGVIGVGVVVVGVGMVVYGVRRDFDRRLRISNMRRRTRRAANILGCLGYVAKGAAFAVVGILIAAAAVTHDPSKSRGLDQALRTLAAQPFGVALLSLLAVGFAEFGFYCFIQSRHRKV